MFSMWANDTKLECLRAECRYLHVYSSYIDLKRQMDDHDRIISETKYFDNRSDGRHHSLKALIKIYSSQVV